MAPQGLWWLLVALLLVSVALVLWFALRLLVWVLFVAPWTPLPPWEEDDSSIIDDWLGPPPRE